MGGCKQHSIATGSAAAWRRLGLAVLRSIAIPAESSQRLPRWGGRITVGKESEESGGDGRGAGQASGRRRRQSTRPSVTLDSSKTRQMERQEGVWRASRVERMSSIRQQQCAIAVPLVLRSSTP